MAKSHLSEVEERDDYRVEPAPSLIFEVKGI